MTGAAPQIRFERFVLRTDTCWLWTGAKTELGYGRFRYDGKARKAHRVAYEWAHGPIPAGLTIDHLCRVPACVNPAHLEAVTVAENTRRGVGPSALHARQVSCVNGHPFDDENTQLVLHSDGRPRRQCRACVRDRSRRYYADRKAAL